MSREQFKVGDRVVDRRDTKAIEGAVESVRADGMVLVRWPEGRYWQRPSDLVKAPTEAIR